MKPLLQNSRKKIFTCDLVSINEKTEKFFILKNTTKYSHVVELHKHLAEENYAPLLYECVHSPNSSLVIMENLTLSGFRTISDFLCQPKAVLNTEEFGDIEKKVSAA